MFNKILVPLDGSKPADSILTYVSQFAKALKSDVLLLSVLDSGTSKSAGFTADIHEGSSRQSIGEGGSHWRVQTEATTPVSQDHHDQTRTYLEQQAQHLTQAGVKAEALILEGSAEDKIVECAVEKNCDVIALSAWGRSGPSGGLGAVSAKVLQASNVPVILCSPDMAEPYSKNGLQSPQIVVPLDGSSFGEMALPYAEELSQHLKSKISLIHVLRSMNPALLSDPFTGSIPSKEALEAFSEDAGDYVQSVVETLKGEGIEVEAEVLKGKPSDCIVKFSEEKPQSLTIMTTHGHGAMARWLLGSVTDRVTRNAKDAILIIPGQYGKSQAGEITELLAKTSIFAPLSEDALLSIAQDARVRTFAAGEMIVEEGDETGSMFIINEGSVEVLKGTTVVDEMGVGTFFGEMSILENHPRSASIRAKEAVSCVSIRRIDFAGLLQRRPHIAVEMLPELAKRLREAREEQMNN